MKTIDWLALAGFVALSECAGVLGSLFTAPAIAGWYAMLAKPALAPPDWVFAPVWTTLFLLMGVAAFVVWRHAMHRRLGKEALAVFALQLALNVLWSALFFGLHNPGLALAEIAVLSAAILWSVLLFNKVSRIAALLLLPYLAWVSFAAYLNYAIWILN
jgi:tryptophan-rich sensory protein